MIWLSSTPGLRKSRVVLVAAIVGLLFFWHLASSPRPPPASHLQFTPSSLDWSTQRQFYPPSSIKPLPTDKPRKLPQVQANNGKFRHTSETKSRQKAVRDEFIRSYMSYKQYAWMKDELMPLSVKGKDNYGGWAATLVDSLDTLWIMDLKEEFNDAAQAAATLNWGETHEGAVNLFETTIRHLGGLLSAYELSGQEAILKKAVELGEMLYVAFDTPNRMPGFWLNFEDARKGKQVAGIHDPSASPGSLVMEFTRLSQITGDPKFYDATDRVTQFLFKTQNSTLLPGMWPVCLDFQNEQVHDNTFSLGALADSLYEYLPKMHALLGGIDGNYEIMYRTAMDVVIKNLLYRPMLPQQDDVLFAGDIRINEQAERSTESQHLTCFTGGMFALGGKLLNIEEHVKIGEKLARGCGWAYKVFPTGMMPEIFDLTPCPYFEPCNFDKERWRPQRDLLPPGFVHARDPRYLLRPEAIESIFYMYRITADPQWQDMAWDMFQSIVRLTSTEHANAGIADVVNTETVKIDSMEETLNFTDTLSKIRHPDLAHFECNWRRKIIEESPKQARLTDYGFTSNLPPNRPPTDQSWPADVPVIPFQRVIGSLDVAFELTRDCAFYSEAEIPPFLHVCAESRLVLQRWGYRLFFSTRTCGPRTWFHPGRDRLYIPNELCPDDEDRADMSRHTFYRSDFRCPILSGSYWDMGQFSAQDLKDIQYLVLGTNYVEDMRNLSDSLAKTLPLVPRLKELFIENWSLDYFYRWVEIKGGLPSAKSPWKGLVDCIPVEDIDIISDVYWLRGQIDDYEFAPLTCLSGRRNCDFHYHRKTTTDPFHATEAKWIEEDLAERIGLPDNYQVPIIRHVNLLPEAYTDLFLKSRHDLWTTLQCLDAGLMQRADFRDIFSKANQNPPPFNVGWASTIPPSITWQQYLSLAQGRDLTVGSSTEGYRIIRSLLQVAYLNRYEIEEPKFDVF
ncbi:hypothetical protein FGRMN_2335 [Fusarium graminum]|nr:hypothetical protein FGRMN_2335 [Fusarium graminum]